MLTIPQTRPLQFALIGSAPASIQAAPYADPSWQIWGCSPGAYGVIPKGRSNLWWELHRYEPGQTWFSPEYCQFLRDHPNVAVSALRAEIPNGFIPDKAELERKYGRYFFTSSIATMMACAIDLIEAAGCPAGSKIGLWGVDMAANEEYEGQRAGLHFFAHIAKQKGIEVGVPPTSDLFTPRFFYGFDEQTHSFVKMRARKHELETRLAAAEQRAAQAQQEAFFLKGAMDDLNYCFQTWADKSTHVEPPALGTVALMSRSVGAAVDAYISEGTAIFAGVDKVVPVPLNPFEVSIVPKPTTKRRKRSKANGKEPPAPTIAGTRLGPGRFV